MKKFLLALGISILGFGAGCDWEDAEVRFENASTAYIVHTPIRMGTAQFNLSGEHTLDCGEYTDYREVEEDHAWVQMKDMSTGKWSNVSASELGPLDAGYQYTIVITGNSGSLAFELVEDK